MVNDMTEIKIIENNVEWVRGRAEIYLSELSVSAICDGVAEDALVKNSSDVNLIKISGWGGVVSKVNWLVPNSQQHTVEKLFNCLTNFPEKGPNSIRHEVFVSALSEVVFIYEEGQFSIIQGDNFIPDFIKKRFVVLGEFGIGFQILSRYRS